MPQGGELWEQPWRCFSGILCERARGWMLVVRAEGARGLQGTVSSWGRPPQTQASWYTWLQRAPAVSGCEPGKLCQPTGRFTAGPNLVTINPRGRGNQQEDGYTGTRWPKRNACLPLPAPHPYTLEEHGLEDQGWRGVQPRPPPCLDSDSPSSQPWRREKMRLGLHLKLNVWTQMSSREGNGRFDTVWLKIIIDRFVKWNCYQTQVHSPNAQ